VAQTRRDFLILAAATSCALGVALLPESEEQKPQTKEAEPASLPLSDGMHEVHIKGATLVSYNFVVEGWRKDMQVQLVVQDKENYEYVIEFCVETPWTQPAWLLKSKPIDIVFKNNFAEMYIDGVFYKRCTAIEQRANFNGCRSLEFYAI
jgi:hypothetical protein